MTIGKLKNWFLIFYNFRMWPGVLVAPHQPHPAADGPEQHEQLPGQQGEGHGGRGVVRVCPHDQGIELATNLCEVPHCPGNASTSTGEKAKVDFYQTIFRNNQLI